MTSDSLRKRTKQPPDLEELGELLLGEDGDHNSDRSIAIMGAAMVEYYLGEAIYEHMRELKKDERDRLFEDMGP